MLISEEDYLAHYGILRRSGRYPWGSGETQDARNRTFLGMVDSLKKQGMSETAIAETLKLTTTELRAAKSIAKNEVKQSDIIFAQKLKDKGYSNVAIGKRMKINESSVRALLAPGQKDKADVLEATSNMLKDQLNQKEYLDIGTGVERHLGISGTKLSTAVARLQEEGYKVHYLKVEQLGTGQQTTIKVLSKPGVPYSEVFKNRDKVRQISGHSEDGGRTYLGIKPPISIDPKRIAVRYAEDGGAKEDGVIYVRPGKEDISLGGSRYAQVRIAVNNTHYLKGMAMYKDDLPDGVDLMFNTNKSNTGNKLDAMKKMSDDPDNPFGSSIQRQIYTKDGKNLSSAMNIVNEEGNWSDWSRSLSAQVLSKQKPSLAKTQLDMMYERKQAEYDSIMKLTNPTIRKRLLESFSDDVDSSAVHLKAAALPRQATHVILPLSSISEKEVYAPRYRDGERVVLIRFPHGGKFEIPELVVNNRHKEGRRLIGNEAKDAIGINSKVAERLSGADFDGDTVLVIPNNRRNIETSPPLKGLDGFDPMKYKLPADSPIKRMGTRTKAREMGEVSNLITDMTIRGANNDELARAVRHSMVVIDAEKHELNYKQSEADNGIKQLKQKYQGKTNAGASTLISRAGSRIDVPLRKPRSAAKGGPIDPLTGEKVYEETGESWVNKKGKVVVRTQRSKKLAETNDAHTLSSGKTIEKIYADHSNRLKALANKARLDTLNTKSIPYSPSARKTYSKEVESLNAKLNIALKNAPLERQAQLVANTILAQKRDANPDMDASDIKKVKAQALQEARNRTGARKQRIEISDQEWAAIQAGAISTNKLNQILSNSDLDVVKQLATPRTKATMTPTKLARARDMLDLGYTQADVADQLGVSVSTLTEAMS